MLPPRTKHQPVLQLAHDAKSLVCTIDEGPLNTWRLSYLWEGSPVPKVIDLPKRAFAGNFIPGVQAIVTIVVTQANVGVEEVPELPPGMVGLNGKKLI